MRPTVCFSHGQDGEPWGTKIRAMAEVAQAAGHPVDSLDYRGVSDPLARAAMLTDWCRALKAPAVLVGSSMGGFVALRAAVDCGAVGLLLIAPALLVPGYAEHLPRRRPECPLTIVHGWDDDVVPWEHSLQYSATHRARLVMLDADHRLSGCVDGLARLFGLFLGELADRPQPS